MISTNQQPDLECGRVDWLGCHRHETDSTFLFSIEKRLYVLVLSITSNIRYATRCNQLYVTLALSMFHSLYSILFIQPLSGLAWSCTVGGVS